MSFTAGDSAWVWVVLAVACGAPSTPPTPAPDPATAPVERCDWREVFEGLAPCPGATHPEAVGVWTLVDEVDGRRMRSAPRFVYDGCTVTFVYLETAAMTPFAALDAQRDGDPYPLLRARARWRNDTLHAAYIFDQPRIAELVDGGFETVSSEPVRLSRVTSPDELDRDARELLCARRIAPDTRTYLQAGGAPPPVWSSAEVDEYLEEYEPRSR